MILTSRQRTTMDQKLYVYFSSWFDLHLSNLLCLITMLFLAFAQYFDLLTFFDISSKQRLCIVF